MFEIQVAALMSGAPVFVILTICHESTHTSIFDQRAPEEKLTRNRTLVAEMTCEANLDKNIN